MSLAPQRPSPRVTRRLVWYGFVVFVSSACLLVLEIVAGRLLAPYIGVSLYTWTSIIGLILAGLSLGNWLGGRWADRGAGEGVAGGVLLASALFSLAIPGLLMLVAPLVQARPVSLLGASFVYVAVLFVVPSIFLGVVTPLLTTLALASDRRAGHVVGRMHALAALGSIAGTFLTGYWLVQTFGTRMILVGITCVLAFLAVPFLARRAQVLGVAVLALAGTGTWAYFSDGLVNPCTTESNYYCLRVVEDTSGLAPGAARSLVLDHMTHSTNHRDHPDLLLVSYVHAMDELIRYRFDERTWPRLRVFFAGGGAYTHPRALRHYRPASELTIAEIDPAVTATARDELFVETDGTRVFHADARTALERLTDESFDVVVSDVFHDLAVPYHLTTREYARLVRARLAPGGLYLVNIVDVFPDPRLVKSIIKTLGAEFARVDVWMERPPDLPTRLTYVLSASDGPALPDTLSASHGLARTWYRLTRPVTDTGTPMKALTVLTDDYAPVESLVAPLFTGPQGL